MSQILLSPRSPGMRLRSNAQRGALPQQILKIFRAFHAFFHRPGGVQHLVQLYQRRDKPVGAAGMLIGPTLRIEQAQRPDTGFVVDPGEKIDGRQGDRDPVGAIWRMRGERLAHPRRPAQCPPGPGKTPPLWVLDAGDRLQVRQDREEPRVLQRARLAPRELSLSLCTTMAAHSIDSCA